MKVLTLEKTLKIQEAQASHRCFRKQMHFFCLDKTKKVEGLEQKQEKLQSGYLKEQESFFLEQFRLVIKKKRKLCHM